MIGRGASSARGGSASGRTLTLVLRALREFATVPLLVILGCCLLAVVAILGDQTHVAGLDVVRRALGHVVGAKAASSTLQAIATGLVTVTSITFSVLLLAVQQTASNLSPVIFDQFVRRRANQVLLGFFVGLALFAYVVMAVVQDNTPPIIGAFVATVLTVVAMVFLLILVYTTIDQMRPSNVLRQIHDRTLVAREREADLVRRTRRHERSSHPVSASYYSQTTGYVTGIDLDRLANALRTVPDAEIRLRITLGEHVAYGDVVASVRDDDEATAQSLADEVRSAVVIGKRRDLDHDATTGIDELGNIAWTNGSSAKHSPEVARQALDAVRDIVARWLAADPAVPSDQSGELAIVYPDNDLDRALDVLYSLLVVAQESHQHMQAARVVEAYRTLLRQSTGQVHRRLERDLEAAGPLLDNVPPSPLLNRALAAARDTGVDGQR